ncbi:MAG: hydrogenase expression/formation protein HypE, partial [Zestosphaera sp.]
MTQRLITLAHGAGAAETWRLIKELIIDRVPEKLKKIEGGYGLDVLDDSATIKVGDDLHVVITTDSYTVSPYRFPGGDIGSLVAHGVINDLVVSGARPVAFMDTIVVEEGFPEAELSVIINSLISALIEDNVSLIGGDFKVMPKGTLDKILITGVGIGLSRRPIPDNELSVGDKIIVTGYVAEHGATILAAQLGLLDKIKGLRSDTKSLARTVLKVIEEFRDYVHAARDPTRGGLASVLNEWARSNNLTIRIHKDRIPVRDEVRDFLEAMGVDYLSMASEGIALLAVDSRRAPEILERLKEVGEENSEII